jgi:hypothetical protein
MDGWMLLIAPWHVYLIEGSMEPDIKKKNSL